MKIKTISSKDVKRFDNIVGYIFETSDFSLFKPFEHNRKIDEQQVRKIMAGIKAGTLCLLGEIRIVVLKDGSLLIVDGHHRVVAAMRLQKEGYPVSLRFIVMTEDDILKQGFKSIGQFIQHLNNDRKDWSLEDMIYLWASEENDAPDSTRKQSYEQLIELSESGKYFDSSRSIWRSAAIILSNGVKQVNTLKKGDFRSQMSNEQFEYYYKKIVAMADALGIALKNNYVEAFINAWFNVKGTVQYDRFIDEYGFGKFKENLSKLSVDITQSNTQYWENIFKIAIQE